MRIFILEDNVQVAGESLDYIFAGHEIYHVFNLKDAMHRLQFDPGVNNIDMFFFDVGIKKEDNVLKYPHAEGVISYNHPRGFNGLLFLLNNIPLLKTKLNYISIITAFHQQVIELREIDVFGNIFSQTPNESQNVGKIKYIDGNSNTYLFSILNKGEHDIIRQICRLIQ